MRVTVDTVENDLDHGDSGWAQLRGGPCDGRLDPIEPDTAELQVIMSDGQQHLYRRTDLLHEVDGRSVAVFEWVGRQFGPR